MKMAGSSKRSSRVEIFQQASCFIENKKKVKRIQCKFCDQLLADGDGTTSLMNHLQAKHPEEYKRAKLSDDSSTSKQTTLTGGMFRKCSAQRSSAITDLIIEFVSRDLRPLSVVNGEGFKKL